MTSDSDGDFTESVESFQPASSTFGESTDGDGINDSKKPYDKRLDPPPQWAVPRGWTPEGAGRVSSFERTPRGDFRFDSELEDAEDAIGNIIGKKALKKVARKIRKSSDFSVRGAGRVETNVTHMNDLQCPESWQSELKFEIGLTEVFLFYGLDGNF
jgi:hypothetical protein